MPHSTAVSAFQADIGRTMPENVSPNSRSLINEIVIIPHIRPDAIIQIKTVFQFESRFHPVSQISHTTKSDTTVEITPHTDVRTGFPDHVFIDDPVNRKTGLGRCRSGNRQLRQYGKRFFHFHHYFRKKASNSGSSLMNLARNAFQASRR